MGFFFNVKSKLKFPKPPSVIVSILSHIIVYFFKSDIPFYACQNYPKLLYLNVSNKQKSHFTDLVYKLQCLWNDVFYCRVISCKVLRSCSWELWIQTTCGLIPPPCPLTPCHPISPVVTHWTCLDPLGPILTSLDLFFEIF